MTMQQQHAYRRRGIIENLKQQVAKTKANMERGETGPLSPLQILDGQSIYMVAIENDELVNHKSGGVVCVDLKTAAEQTMRRSHAIATTEDIERDAQQAAAHQAEMQAREDRTAQRRTIRVEALAPSKGK
jgi:hypothetical protein